MFFNLAWRNSKRSRNENLIYFLTMVTAVAAFYIVLSLGAQDVIRFLSTKHELCNVLWGTEEYIDENALQVTFTRLRKTLREFGLEDRIETVRGQGYRLKEQVRL